MCVVDISEITLENITDYMRDIHKENRIAKRKLQGKPLTKKEYYHWYYIAKIKEKRKQNKLKADLVEKVSDFYENIRSTR